jgi:hypothetical protein
VKREVEALFLQKLTKIFLGVLCHPLFGGWCKCQNSRKLVVLEKHMEAFGIFGFLLVLLGVVIAVLWVFMPFAIFGQKDLTRDLIREQQRTNDLLEKLTSQRASGT